MPKKYLTPDQYVALGENGWQEYAPEYKQYKTEKYRAYSECDCCGHRTFVGWAERQVPIGEPWRYVRLSERTIQFNRMFMRKFAEMTEVSVFWNAKPLNADTGKTITFTRYADKD